MYRFVSSANPVELKRRYLAKYNHKLLQKKLDKLLSLYPEIKAALPADISAKKLLIGNFKYLAKVYCAFVDEMGKKSEGDRKTILEKFVTGGFRYDTHKGDIKEFLLDPNNGFEIYNCVYCDLESVREFTKACGRKVRKFETEHVLDKGECPLVAMSLYNFVLSCDTCNGADMKGTKTIGDIEDEIAKLSPTAEGYDFDEKVKFVVDFLNPAASDLRPLDHPNDYEVSFDVKNKLYQKSIDLFELKQRYNEKLIKEELLFWREKRKNNPDNIVQQMADIRKVPFDELFEEYFELKKNKSNHAPMEKARREVMMM